MIKFLISTFLFFLLVTFECGFIHSLPSPFFYAPLVFVCGVYLYQHLNSLVGAWWIFGLGVWLDFWHLGLVPFETIIYAITALLMIFLGQRFFSNRSLYGIAGNATLSLLFIHFVHLIYFFVVSFNDSLPFLWFSFLGLVFWQIFFQLFLITILFFLARKIRSVLKGLLIVPNHEGL